MFDIAKPEQKDKAERDIQNKQEKTSTSANLTGIPDNMKTRFENLSGFSFDDVRVHYNSDKPAQLQALAYTQGNQVYVAPGQERHLGHELGHVAQQKQGIVKPSGVIDGFPLNDAMTLEREADAFSRGVPIQERAVDAYKRSHSGVVQRLIFTREFLSHHIMANVNEAMFDRSPPNEKATINTVILHKSEDVKKHVETRMTEAGVDATQPDTDFLCNTYEPDATNDGAPRLVDAQSGWRLVTVFVGGSSIYHLHGTNIGNEAAFDQRNRRASVREDAMRQERIRQAEQVKADTQILSATNQIYEKVYGVVSPADELRIKHKEKAEQATQVARSHCEVISLYQSYKDAVNAINGIAPDLPETIDGEKVKTEHNDIMLDAFKKYAYKEVCYEDERYENNATTFDTLYNRLVVEGLLEREVYEAFLAKIRFADDAQTQLVEEIKRMYELARPLGLTDLVEKPANERAFIYWINHI